MTTLLKLELQQEQEEPHLLLLVEFVFSVGGVCQGGGLRKLGAGFTARTVTLFFFLMKESLKSCFLVVRGGVCLS